MNKVIDYRIAEYYQLRNSPEHRKWTKLVLKRDNYTCQKCGSKDKADSSSN